MLIPTALQIFATLFALFALSRVFLRMKGHELTLGQSAFWAIIWTGVIIVVWVPSTAFAISDSLGLDTRKPIDTFVYIAIVVLFYLTYRMHVKQERTDHQLTQLVRQIAIRDARKKQ